MIPENAISPLIDYLLTHFDTRGQLDGFISAYVHPAFRKRAGHQRDRRTRWRIADKQARRGNEEPARELVRLDAASEKERERVARERAKDLRWLERDNAKRAQGK